MIDKKVQMMDAGMVLFTSKKPFGTVLGGIKTEMARLGDVKRTNEISKDDIPDTTGECDLFVDWSTPMRWRAISCRLEDAGFAGTDEEGEEIRRYALCMKEGNMNRKVKVFLVIFAAVAIVVSGICGISGIPDLITVLAGFALAFEVVVLGLKPSAKAQREVRNILETASGAE